MIFNKLFKGSKNENNDIKLITNIQNNNYITMTERKLSVITVVGNCDKRIIALPLARALSFIAKTAIITDDTSFKRLFKFDEYLGSISNVDILIEPINQINYKSIIKLDNPPQYKFIIFVAEKYVYKKSNLIIRCNSVNDFAMGEEIKIDDIENKNSDNVYNIVLTCKEIKNKKQQSDTNEQFLLSPNHYIYLATMEEVKILLPLAYDKLIIYLSGILSKAIGEKDDLIYQLFYREKVGTNVNYNISSKQRGSK